MAILMVPDNDVAGAVTTAAHPISGRSTTLGLLTMHLMKLSG